MKNSRLFAIACLSVVLVTGAFGCTKKQQKTDMGQIEPTKPSAEEKAPATPPSSEVKPGDEGRKTAEAPPGPVEQPERKEAGRDERALKDVHYDFDKYELRSEDSKILDENAAWLKANPKAISTIEGHCDERGTVEYNLALGERRAKVARDYLVSLGIGAERLKTISYGKSKPVDPGHDEAAWAQNRRAHFVVQ